VSNGSNSNGWQWFKVIAPIIAVVIFLASVLFHSQDTNIHESPIEKSMRIEREVSPVRGTATDADHRSRRNEVRIDSMDDRLDELREGQQDILQEIRSLHGR